MMQAHQITAYTQRICGACKHKRAVCINGSGQMHCSACCNHADIEQLCSGLPPMESTVIRTHEPKQSGFFRRF